MKKICVSVALGLLSVGWGIGDRSPFVLEGSAFAQTAPPAPLPPAAPDAGPAQQPQPGPQDYPQPAYPQPAYSQPGYPQGYPQGPYPQQVPPTQAGVPQNNAFDPNQPRPPQRLPARLDYIDGAPLPPGYRVDTTPRIGLAVAGWVTFGTLYLTSAVTAGFIIDANNEDGQGSGGATLFIPALGPFISLGTVHPSGSGSVLLVIDGLGQCAGLAMGIAAFAAPKKIIVRTQYATLHFDPLTIRGGAATSGLAGEF